MSEPKLTLSQVTSGIVSGDFKIKPVVGSYDVWEKFGIVTHDDKNVDFAACKLCFTAVSYSGRKTGTSTLKRHKCRLLPKQPYM